MKRISILLIVVLLLAVLVRVTHAATPFPPIEDAFVDINRPTQNLNGLGLVANGSEGTCNETYWFFMKWDLSSLPGSYVINNAQITLNVNDLDLGGSENLVLYQVLDDSWIEGTITSGNDPAVGAIIETKAAPTALGAYTFGSLTGPTSLATYLTSQRNPGDGIASMAVKIGGICQAGYISYVAFDDSEVTATAPTLDLLNPTAVTMLGFNAGQSQDIWITNIGLVALAGLLLITVRRRLLA